MDWRRSFLRVITLYNDPLAMEFRKKTEKRKLTREDNLYGVFAEDMTETNSPKTKRRQTDLEFTEPVSFVSLEKVILKKQST